MMIRGLQIKRNVLFIAVSLKGEFPVCFIPLNLEAKYESEYIEIGLTSSSFTDSVQIEPGLQQESIIRVSYGPWLQTGALISLAKLTSNSLIRL